MQKLKPMPASIQGKRISEPPGVRVLSSLDFNKGQPAVGELTPRRHRPYLCLTA